MLLQLRSIVGLLLDGIYAALPSIILPRQPYRFAFLVHPRNRRDIERKIPLLAYTPNWVVRFFERHFWPGVLVPINGLTSRDTGKPIEGYVISIPMTAETMLQERASAVKQIRRAVVLARKRGARIAGLGALTASLTRGGLDLVDIPGIGITTGHAYTGYNVTATLTTALRELGAPLKDVTVAIVGAAGSVGSIAAEILASEDERPSRIILIDLPRKHDRLSGLIARLREVAPAMTVDVRDDVAAIREAHAVITATNTPSALIKKEHVHAGQVIVDDAQPSDVAPDVLGLPEVLVLSAGAVRTPHIETRFPMGLHGAHVNFCCLAEVLILASEGREEHYVIHRTDLAKVREVAAGGAALGFSVAPLQNERGLIQPEHLARVRAALAASLHHHVV